jgi:hypothetical protein
MVKKFICASARYYIAGPQEDTICLPVAPLKLSPTLEIEKHTLLSRSTFHVSLVCIGQIAKKNHVGDPNFVKNVADDFCEYTQQTSIDFKKFRNEFRFLSEDEKRAIVVMCDVTNLKPFFEMLNQKYNLNLAYPPTHVTLYTLQPDMGIFMSDVEDVQKLSKIVQVPIALNI